jgi:protein-L-isoaspartate(D-aspartate) O-methyltransferase
MFRSMLVDDLVRRGTVKTQAVERALRSVPRHVFLQGIDLRVAYADDAVALKFLHAVAVSSVSQPSMVASMLEMLEVDPGARVLEIGTGSGYNAALLYELLSEHAGAESAPGAIEGCVVSIELDPELCEQARENLGSAGYPGVEVHCGDGLAGWPDGAPYDRIIVTASAKALPRAWVDQLADRGRMIVPLADELNAVVFKKSGSELQRVGSCPALFIPLR